MAAKVLELSPPSGDAGRVLFVHILTALISFLLYLNYNGRCELVFCYDFDLCFLNHSDYFLFATVYLLWRNIYQIPCPF